MIDPLTRAYAAERDAADPLRPFRDRFVVDDPDLIYLDGNSLGRLPASTVARLDRAVREEWGAELIRGWDHWIDEPVRVGDRIGAAFLGAGPGQVVVADSTTVNLYRLAVAAVTAATAADPERRVLVTDDDNFPTDRYVLDAVAAQHGLELRQVRTDQEAGLDPAAVAAAVGPDTALVSFSHVAYRSGAVADLAAVTALAHDAGARVLWDLSHSAGAVPVDLDAAAADLAVGCTYKYLNGGPGAPAFLYVRRDLQDRLANPVPGWFGQRDQFAMGPRYEPAPGVARFLVGTTPVLALAAVDEGVAVLAEAGLDRLRAKGRALTGYLVDLADARLAPLGFRLVSPRDASRRGSHVTLHHRDAWPVVQAMKARGVLPDFRAPDRVRMGLAPVYTGWTDVWDAVDRVADLVAAGEHERYPRAAGRVT